MKKKIKIAYFADVLKKGLDGVTNTVYNITKRFPEDKYELIFITPHPPDEEDEFPFNVFVCKFLKFPGYKDYRIAIPILYNTRLRHILKFFKPDIIHFTTPSLLGKYAVNYARKNNIKLSTTYHTHFISYVDYYLYKTPNFSKTVKLIGQKMMEWYYNKCDIIFVPSQALFEELIKIGIQKERLWLWGRGVDNDIFSPSYKDPDLVPGLTSNKNRSLLYVGRIVWEKDIQILKDIYKSIQKSKQNISIIVTGEGPQKEILQSKMPKAIFTGSLYGEDLAKLYASCDIFVFPSTTETFGNVVLEAMASGLPVVVSNKGGQVGFVKDMYSGMIAKAKDSKDFINKINLLLSNDQLYNSIRDNALSYAKSQSWDKLVQKLFVKYDELHMGELYKNKKSPYEISN